MWLNCDVLLLITAGFSLSWRHRYPFNSPSAVPWTRRYWTEWKFLALSVTVEFCTRNHKKESLWSESQWSEHQGQRVLNLQRRSTNYLMVPSCTALCRWSLQWTAKRSQRSDRMMVNMSRLLKNTVTHHNTPIWRLEPLPCHTWRLHCQIPKPLMLHIPRKTGEGDQLVITALAIKKTVKH